MVYPGPAAHIPTIDVNDAPDGEGHLSEEYEEILSSGVLDTGSSEASLRRQGETVRPESPPSPQLDYCVRVTVNEPYIVTHSWTLCVPQFRSVPQKRICRKSTRRHGRWDMGRKRRHSRIPCLTRYHKRSWMPAWNIVCNITLAWRYTQMAPTRQRQYHSPREVYSSMSVSWRSGDLTPSRSCANSSVKWLQKDRSLYL
jgi:hypothetical protein